MPRALMARRRHLSTPPIREAVLDVRVEAEEPADPSRLRKALEESDRFPEIHVEDTGLSQPTVPRIQSAITSITSTAQVSSMAWYSLGAPVAECWKRWLRSGKARIS